MAILDLSYAPWSGSYESRIRRVWALALSNLRGSFSNRWNLLVIGLIYTMILGWLFILYVIASTDNPPLFVLGNRLYRDWFFNHSMYGFLIMILAATVGASLISRDLQHHALLTLLSKAITRTDYLLAKFLALTLFLLTVTLAPGLLLFLGQWAMSAEEIGWDSRLRDFGAVSAHSLVLVVPIAALVLAFSSLTRRPYVAGMLWILFFLLSWALPGMFESAVGTEWVKLLRLQNLTAHAGDWFYESRPMKVAFLRFDRPSDLPMYRPWVSFLLLGGLTWTGLLVARLRLRISEVRE